MRIEIYFTYKSCQIDNLIFLSRLNACTSLYIRIDVDKDNNTQNVVFIDANIYEEA